MIRFLHMMVLSTATDRAEARSCICGLEWRKDLLSTNIQVFNKFWQICWGWYASEGETTNTCMVRTWYYLNWRPRKFWLETKHDIIILMIWCADVTCMRNRCDRILWYGEGLQQLSYVRGESRFSDHRPVYGMFWAEVESTNNRLKKSMSYSSSRIEVEELLPYSHGYTELNFFWPMRRHCRPTTYKYAHYLYLSPTHIQVHWKD